MMILLFTEICALSNDFQKLTELLSCCTAFYGCVASLHCNLRQYTRGADNCTEANLFPGKLSKDKDMTRSDEICFPFNLSIVLQHLTPTVNFQYFNIF